MRKVLVSLMMGGFCCLAAMDEAVWEHDFHEGKSIRRIGDAEKIFDIRRERSVDPVEALPESAEADVWYPIMQNIILDLKSTSDDEEIKGLVFAQTVCELMFTYVEGQKSTHAHYGDPFKVKSGFKTVTRYKCYACESTQVLMKISKRVTDGEEIITLAESPAELRHARGEDIGHDFLLTRKIKIMELEK